MTTFTYLNARTNDPLLDIEFTAVVPPLPLIGITITLLNGDTPKAGVVTGVHLVVDQDTHVHTYFISVAIA
jgi:hypothetical protein